MPNPSAGPNPPIRSNAASAMLHLFTGRDTRARASCFRSAFSVPSHTLTSTDRVIQFRRLVDEGRILLERNWYRGLGFEALTTTSAGLAFT